MAVLSEYSNDININGNIPVSFWESFPALLVASLHTHILQTIPTSFLMKPIWFADNLPVRDIIYYRIFPPVSLIKRLGLLITYLFAILYITEFSHLFP
jgi:hypothetical protein